LPLKRPIIALGKYSKVIVIPKSWIEFYESETGQKITDVLIDIDKELRIRPFLKEGDKHGK
jgi:hypothetical protein